MTEAIVPAKDACARTPAARLVEALCLPLRSIALVSLVVSAPTWADECAQLPPPSVTLKRFEEPLSLDTTYSHKSLAILASHLARPGNRILGLTRGTARVAFAVKIPLIIDRSRRWECASPQLVVSYGFSPMMVYVAKEFPAGSCAYAEIHKHELQHVKTYQDHLARIENDVADTLNRRFATGSPWRGPVGQTQTVLERELNERWIPYITREIERVESAQALIDAPEEYARVAAACNGEMERIIR